jgi:hypothetical protein
VCVCIYIDTRTHTHTHTHAYTHTCGGHGKRWAHSTLLIRILSTMTWTQNYDLLRCLTTAWRERVMRICFEPNAVAATACRPHVCAWKHSLSIMYVCMYVCICMHVPASTCMCVVRAVVSQLVGCRAKFIGTRILCWCIMANQDGHHMMLVDKHIYSVHTHTHTNTHTQTSTCIRKNAPNIHAFLYACACKDAQYSWSAHAPPTITRVCAQSPRTDIALISEDRYSSRNTQTLTRPCIHTKSHNFIRYMCGFTLKCICIYICMYVRMHIYIYIHTYMQAQN